MKKTQAAPALALALASTAVPAATFELDLTADGDGRFFEYFSDAFAQIDQGGVGGNPDNDGYFLASSLPAFAPIGGGVDVFPNESAFGVVGTLNYDVTGLLGSGIESAPITALDVQFEDDINASLTIVANNTGGNNFSTVVNSASGTVTLFNGAVSGVNLSSEVSFVFGGAVPFTGTFDVSGSRFSLLVDETLSLSGFDFRYAWDVDGELNGLAPIPVPASAFLFAPAAAGLLGVGGRRRGDESVA
jgi:hypothetical protein